LPERYAGWHVCQRSRQPDSEGFGDTVECALNPAKREGRKHWDVDVAMVKDLPPKAKNEHKIAQWKDIVVSRKPPPPYER
jgi:hypothetical protein